MSKGKKYDFRVTQGDNGWKTEITRRMTSTKTVVSKSHDGFATEAEAQEKKAVLSAKLDIDSQVIEYP